MSILLFQWKTFHLGTGKAYSSVLPTTCMYVVAGDTDVNKQLPNLNPVYIYFSDQLLLAKLLNS